MATMLALGIPGGQATAVLIGAFMLQGLLPGPRLFYKHMHVVYGLIAAEMIEEIVLVGAGLVVAYYFAGIVGSMSTATEAKNLESTICFEVNTVFLKN